MPLTGGLVVVALLSRSSGNVQRRMRVETEPLVRFPATPLSG